MKEESDKLNQTIKFFHTCVITILKYMLCILLYFNKDKK